MAVANSLPSLSSEYALEADQAREFRENGHILLRNVCSPEEIAAYRPLFADAVAMRAKDYAPLAERDTYGKAFLQIMNLWEEEEALRVFVLARRFAKIAGDLMGVRAVRLYHDQALFKEGGGGFTPWHQDQHYWPLDTNNTLTMWMPLVDVTAEMGTMHFASGSHTEGYFGDSGIGDGTEEIWGEFVKKRGFKVVNHGAMKAGDATFHYGWTLHGASGNQSNHTREVMTMIYYEDGVLVKTPDNANRQADLDRWIPGGVAGQAAASKLNPLLYST